MRRGFSLFTMSAQDFASRWGGLTLTLFLVACDGPRSPAHEGVVGSGNLSTPLEVGGIRDRPAALFRSSGQGWVSEQGTLQVAATRDGSFQLVARHQSRRSRSLRSRSAAAAMVSRPLVVQTVSVAGLSGSEHATADVRAADDGSLAIERGAVREVLRGSEQGIEQSWLVQKRPAGTADLVIGVSVSGLPLLAQTETGLHFAQAGGDTEAPEGLGIRYGRATWVDADGRHTDVELGFVGGEIRLTVPRAVLDASRFPAVLDPYLTPEFGIDNPVLGTGLSNYGATSAFDGTGYFTVWVDGRQPSAHIYGTRVDATGAVLDPRGIAIGTTTGIQHAPAVAYGAGTFLVAWEQGSSSPKIYVSRVTPDGTVVDPAGIAVAAADYNDQLAPAIAFDGTNFMVTWGVGMSSGGRIVAERISPAGKILDATPITVSDIRSVYTEAQGDPAIAFDGTNYLVAWQDDRGTWWDIYANRISPAGLVLDGNGFVVANTSDGENDPGIAFDGTNYLVVWTDWPGAESRESSIFARRVSPAGAVLDTTSLALAVAPGEQSAPGVAFDGTNYLVAWTDYRNGTTSEIFTARVGKDGTLLDPSGQVLASLPKASFGASLVFGAGQYLLTWADRTVHGTRLGLDAASKDGAGFPLTSTPNTQVDPAVAYGSDSYLVVWGDSRASGPSIFGARIGPQGATLDPAGIRISPGADYQSKPVIAWNGTNYLVAWNSTQGEARRVAPAGKVIDAADIDLPGINLSAVASNGADFLAVGVPSPLVSGTIVGVRVSGAGVALDASPFTICGTGGDGFYPRVAFDGANYVVVWEDGRGGSGRHPYGARVSPAGVVLDAEGILLTALVGSGYQNKPDVASDGTGNSFAVWEDSRSYAIRGTRIAATGEVLDPAGVVVVAGATATDLQYHPRIAFDGTNYVVGSVDEKDTTSYSLVSYTLSAVRISPAGAIQAGLAVATHPTQDLPAVVASDRLGGTLFAYVLPDTSAGFPVTRVRARIFFETPPAGTCTTASQCPSGFCVDGVCCDTSCGGGKTNDCLACSTFAGAALNGTCGPIADGQGCSDGNACTKTDHCAAGVCVGEDPVVCVAADVCHAVGTGGSCAGGKCTSTPPYDAGAAEAGRDADAAEAGSDAGKDVTGPDATTDGLSTPVLDATMDRGPSPGLDAGAVDARAPLDAVDAVDAVVVVGSVDAQAREVSVEIIDSSPIPAGPDAGRFSKPTAKGCGCELGGTNKPSLVVLLFIAVVALATRRRRVAPK